MPKNIQEKITINVKTNPTQAKARLDIRRDMSGNYMIFDHIDLDIVFKPGDGVIMLMPKSDAKDSDVVYQSQDRFFEFMTKQGIIDPASVKGSSMIGVMQCEVLQNNSSGNQGQIVIYAIASFIESEREYFRFQTGFKKDEMERLYDPDDEHSTELGEVPQEEKKGSIDPRGAASNGYSLRLYENKSYYAGENDSYPHYITIHDDGSVFILKKSKRGREYHIQLNDISDVKYLRRVFTGNDSFTKHVVLDELIRGRYGAAKWKKNEAGQTTSLDFDEDDFEDDLDFSKF